MHVAYKLKESPLHGIGLFADQDIVKGTLIFTASPLLDVNLTPEQFDSLDAKEKEEVRWWGFFDQPTQMWHVDFDVAHFVNHSYEPTTSQDAGHTTAYLIALRDIQVGEELTQNYLEFETVEDLVKRGISAHRV